MIVHRRNLKVNWKEKIMEIETNQKAIPAMQDGNLH